jgi:hypothetical protein
VQGVMGMKITKIDDTNVDLSLNPKHETKKNQDKNTKVKTKNTKCARLKYK